jgi:hypothetical protein
MGSASSAISSVITSRRVGKGDLDSSILGLFRYDDECDSNGTISIGDLIKIMNTWIKFIQEF